RVSHADPHLGTARRRRHSSWHLSPLRKRSPESPGARRRFALHAAGLAPAPLAWRAVSLRGWEQLCQLREFLARYGRGPVAFCRGRSGRVDRRDRGAHLIRTRGPPRSGRRRRCVGAALLGDGRFVRHPIDRRGYGVQRRRVDTPRDPQPLGRPPASGDGEAGFAARLELQPAFDGTFRVVLYALARATVEVAGDFTDWQPVALRRTGEDTWESWLRIPSGIRRINVRIDGGRW